MAEAPKMPSIPTPVLGNLQSVHDTLMVMKQTLELLMGTRASAPVTRTFVQDDMPTAVNIGDMWVQPATLRISCWDGKKWLLTVGV